ncbi:MAG TPA: hypothetical protein VM285_14250 [Polyangia bacterium]|nr:hypothetical protein [Polyangia bacterium]
MKKTFAVAMAGMLFVLAGTAPAQESAAVAKSAFEEGKTLFEAGDFVRASDAFRRADAARPNWKLLYNIGQCEAAARRYGLALEAFEKYLVEGGDEVDRARQTEVREELVRLRDLVGFARVTGPEGAIVIVDGVARGTAPLGRDLPVAASANHKAEAVVDGIAVAERTFQVSGGRTVDVELAATSAGPDRSDPSNGPVGPAPDPNRSPLKVWGWVAVGVGAALLASGGVTGGLALKKDGELGDECAGNICTSDSYDLLDQRDRLAVASTALFVTGGIVAAAGAVMLFVDGTRDESPAAGTDVSLRVGPGAFALTGRF